ncbi:MAG: methyltransferase domain-containing protein [Planctomycetota bacterium]|nr:methyltransferase domain-containing protein [Planctomycetota bacterium]
MNKEELRRLLEITRFPRSGGYDPEWVVENQMGPNALWLTEWLREDLKITTHDRVLDLGCGKAMSSVFIAREFGASVIANDLWTDASDNFKRIREAGLAKIVCPVRAEAHSLPYAHGFFTCVVSIDAYQYFGTDEMYLPYLCDFIEQGGTLGLVMPALMREFGDSVPGHLRRKQESGGVFWDDKACFSLHTVDWWRGHLQKTGLVEVKVADVLEDGWRYWLAWERALAASGHNVFPSDEQTLAEDAGRYLGFCRLVAKRI